MFAPSDTVDANDQTSVCVVYRFPQNLRKGPRPRTTERTIQMSASSQNPYPCCYGKLKQTNNPIFPDFLYIYISFFCWPFLRVWPETQIERGSVCSNPLAPATPRQSQLLANISGDMYGAVPETPQPSHHWPEVA